MGLFVGYNRQTIGRVPEWSNGGDCKSLDSWVQIPPRPQEKNLLLLGKELFCPVLTIKLLTHVSFYMINAVELFLLIYDVTG